MKKTTHYISTRGNGPIKQETFPKGTVFIAMRPSSGSIAPPDYTDAPPSQLHSSSPLRLPIADRKFWDRLIQRQKGIV